MAGEWGCAWAWSGPFNNTNGPQPMHERSSAQALPGLPSLLINHRHRSGQPAGAVQRPGGSRVAQPWLPVQPDGPRLGNAQQRDGIDPDHGSRLASAPEYGARPAAAAAAGGPGAIEPLRACQGLLASAASVACAEAGVTLGWPQGSPATDRLLVLSALPAPLDGPCTFVLRGTCPPCRAVCAAAAARWQHAGTSPLEALACSHKQTLMCMPVLVLSAGSAHHRAWYSSLQQ